MTDTTNHDDVESAATEEGAEDTCKSEKGWLRNFFGGCASCAAPAAGAGTVGGFALSHIPCCVLLPIFASASGAAASAALQTVTYVASPVIAIGMTLGIDKLRGKDVLNKKGLIKAGASGVLALAMTFGINSIMGNNHSHEHNHGLDHGHLHHNCDDGCDHDHGPAAQHDEHHDCDHDHGHLHHKAHQNCDHDHGHDHSLNQPHQCGDNCTHHVFGRRP